MSASAGTPKSVTQHKIWTGDRASAGPAPQFICLIENLLFISTETRGQEPAQLHVFDVEDEFSVSWIKPRRFEQFQITGLTHAAGMFPKVDHAILLSLAGTDLLSGEGLLLALDLEGDEIWRWAPDSLSVSAAAIFNDRIWATTDGNTLWVIDPQDETKNQNYPLSVNASIAAPLVEDEVVYIPCRTAQLLAMEHDGKLRWHYIHSEKTRAWLEKTPILAKNRIYASFSHSQILALNKNDGTPAWSQSVGPSQRPLSRPATDLEHLYVGARDGLYALDLETGEGIWHFKTDRQVDGAPLISASQIFFSCQDHLVYGLNAANGELIWRSEPFDRRIEIAPILADNKLIIATDRGGLIQAAQRPLDGETLLALGDWQAAISFYEDENETAQVAAIYDQQGLTVEAAKTWEKAGELEKAARLYESAHQWEEAIKIWHNLRAWRREAEALEGHARYLSDQTNIPAQGKVEAWRIALNAWRDEGETDRAAACFREIARHLFLPIIQINVQYESLIKNQYSTLDLELSNDGFGTAYNVSAKAKGDQFSGELEHTQNLYNLHPGRKRREQLAVLPQHHGPSVPLHIQLEYNDQNGETHTIKRTIYVDVAQSRREVKAGTVYNVLVSSAPSITTGEMPLTLSVTVSSHSVELEFGEEIYNSPNKMDPQSLLAAQATSLTSYGQQLFEDIIHGEDNAGNWENATLTGYAHALREGKSLTFELKLDPNDPDSSLHAYPWELMRDKQGKPLAAWQKRPFYRRIEANIRKPRLPSGQLRILVMICNPPNLGEPGNTILQDLAKLDFSQESKALIPALDELENEGQAQYTILSREIGRAATLENLREELSKIGPEAYHILHIICHGLFVRDQYYLLMEKDDDDHPHAFVPAGLLKEILSDSELRLVLLGACLSANNQVGEVLRGFGPELVRGGIPAVIAMQGLLPFKTANQFNKNYYQELARSGRVDVAMAATRTGLYTREGPDSHSWGIPILFMGSRDGWLFTIEKQ